GDNDKNNNNDGDGEPTADAKKQNKSNNEKEEQNKEDIDKEIKSEGTEENGKKVETEKEKQDKADKVDNVQEKQDDDKDEIDEDEFWNTQFTDSGYEELENKVKEEIKKKKTAKRKSNIEIAPPSFSIGLSPNTNKIEERAAKRAKKPSRFIGSPYINKKTATKGKAVLDEIMIKKYLFSMEGSDFDFIFETKEGNATIRDYMQSVAPNLKIESNHPRAKDVLNKKPTILISEWGTNENNTDCGVFLMMHMENYNGENARN
nr:hypothetical protein [Tanacetum cinerariifolium]